MSRKAPSMTSSASECVEGEVSHWYRLCVVMRSAACSPVWNGHGRDAAACATDDVAGAAFALAHSWIKSRRVQPNDVHAQDLLRVPPE